MKTLREIQEEVREWAEQFGDNRSPYTNQKLFSLPPLLGMMEELGELAAPTCKRHQGRYKQSLSLTERQREYRKDIKDALADLMIFMCDYANREGVDLLSTLNAVWETVRNRNQETWEKDKACETTKGGDPIYERGKESLEQNGQGWAEPPEVDCFDLVCDIPEIVEKELDPKQVQPPSYQLLEDSWKWLDDPIEKKPPKFWCDVFHTKILDADGWRGDFGLSLQVPITAFEFALRWGKSTCKQPGNFLFREILDGPIVRFYKSKGVYNYTQPKEPTTNKTGWEVARLIAQTYAEGQNRRMAMRTIDRYEEMEKDANA